MPYGVCEDTVYLCTSVISLFLPTPAVVDVVLVFRSFTHAVLQMRAERQARKFQCSAMSPYSMD